MNDTPTVVNILDIRQEEPDITRRLVEYWTNVGYAPGTIKSRMHVLSLLDNPVTATTQDVIRVLPQGVKPSTTRVYVSSFSAVFRDLITLGLRIDNPAAGIRTPGFHRGMPRPLPTGVLEQLLAQRNRPERDWTILGAFAGFRAGDCAGLARDDLTDTDQGPTVVVDGKGGVVAAIPAHPLVVEVFDRHPGTGLMWRVSPSAVSSRWALWTQSVTGHTLRFHQCRHTFATRVYAASGQDLLVTRDLMRHASVATTQVYAMADATRAVRAVAGL